MSDPPGEQRAGPGATTEVEDPRGDLRWTSIPGLVSDAAARFGDREAVADGDVRLSFAQLERDALRVTSAAMAAGIHPGDRVAMWAPNMAEWIVAALGLVGAGAALVPLNTRFKGPEAAYVLNRSRARALFTVRGFLGIDYPAMLDDEEVPHLERIVLLRDDEGTTSEVTVTDEVPIFGWHEFLAGADGVVEGDEGVAGAPVDAHAARRRWQAVTGEDLSDVIFTSGTTGRPKGAMTTHAQTLRTFSTWASIVGLAEGDRYLVVNPFFHTFGYKAGIIACLMNGAAIVPEPVFDVDKVLATVDREHITVVPGPPTLYQSILDHPRRAAYDLSSLRLAVTGAAVVPVELVERMRSELSFSTVLTAYGLTESTGTVTMCRQGDDPQTIAETSGRAIPGLEVRVVDDGGSEVATGEPGEIVVRGYTVVSGYFEDPEATAEAIDADGWLHTGDIGVMDGDGNVRITDRKKDMFIVGGFNAYPAEIEGALLRHPGVAQAAVIGVPDERMGEVGCAFVVARPGTDPQQLAGELPSWSRDQMANYKVPRHVEVVEALPTNASGKVLKTELRERFAQAPAKGA
ncbi:MAG TPA: FadD3 family acyl-CoA ligase [Acidimicrobiales bacterium]|nr:FadD3 family acyl-CoA ligase [Acidimicrobiales bacterium]